MATKKPKRYVWKLQFVSGIHDTDSTFGTWETVTPGRTLEEAIKKGHASCITAGAEKPVRCKNAVMVGELDE